MDISISFNDTQVWIQMSNKIVYIINFYPINRGIGWQFKVVGVQVSMSHEYINGG